MGKNKKIINDQKWHECDSSFVSELSACTNNPGQLITGDLSYLPAGIQEMPGLRDFYLSGYVDLDLIKENELSGCGEFSLIREDRDKQKSYNYAIGVDDEGKIYYSGPFKYFEAHHESLTGTVNVDDIFGKTKNE